MPVGHQHYLNLILIMQPPSITLINVMHCMLIEDFGGIILILLWFFSLILINFQNFTTHISCNADRPYCPCFCLCWLTCGPEWCPFPTPKSVGSSQNTIRNWENEKPTELLQRVYIKMVFLYLRISSSLHLHLCRKPMTVHKIHSPNKCVDVFSWSVDCHPFKARENLMNRVWAGATFGPKRDVMGSKFFLIGIKIKHQSESLSL